LRRRSEKVPLLMARPGLFRIVSINAGRAMRERLYRMGISEGDIVRVVSNPSYGPVIVQKGNTRVGIGAGMASRIFVQPLEVMENVENLR